MNVYEKLNLARVQFHSKGVKQNGKNAYAGYTYFELADILPNCNAICAELKATVVVKFDKDLAVLEFIDCEKPEDKIVFTSPMSEAHLKGCHEVQNLGAVESYIKRYLYQNCFEIAESDALDSTMNPNEKQSVPKTQAKPNEIGRMKNDIQRAIKDGVLKDEFAQKAQSYINSNNQQGIENVIQYLIGQGYIK